MKLSKTFFLFLSFWTLLLSAPVRTTFAATHTINFGGTSFTPNTLDCEVGDVITWSGAFGFHIIESTSVPATAAAFGPTTATTTSFSYTITVAGTYSYECTIHAAMGMTGTFTATAPATKAFTLATTSLDFGNLRVGSSLSKGDTLKSTGPDAALTISSSPLSQGTSFTTSPTGTNRTVSVGSSETETITFSPTARGMVYDTLTIYNNATTSTDDSKQIFISGKGINGVFTGPTTLGFDKTRVGNTEQLTYNFTNSGDDTLFVSVPGISGSGFSIVGGAAQNILPGAGGTVSVKFSPNVKQNYIGSLTMTAQNNVTVPAISIGGTGISPVISLAPPSSYDMGLALVGGTLSGAIQVTNTGDDTLHVTDISISNTLQGAKFSLVGGSAFMVLPAASTNISFTYTSSTVSIDNALLIITSDDPAAATEQVSITAQSGLPKMSVDTKDTIDFGSVRIGDSATAFLTFTNLGTYPLTVHISGLASNVFSLSADLGSIPPKGNTQASFIYTPLAEGAVTGMAIVQSSDATNSSDTIYFKGIGIKTSLNFPTSIDFHQVNLTKTRDSVLTLINLGSGGASIFRYKLVDTSKGFVLLDTLAHSISANDSVTIKIRFSPMVEQIYAATLSILTDDGAAPTRVINLAGQGINSKLVTDPSAIDFGTIDTGKSSSKTFTLTNTGTASTTITALKVTGDPSFSLGTVTPPIQIDPSGSKDISVLFSPKTGGTFDGTVTITASEGSPISVSLHGIGKVTVVVGSVARTIQDIGLKMSLIPNPNNGSAAIKLMLEKPMNIQFALFDATGKIVHRYEQTSFGEGENSLQLNGEILPSGEYYLRAISGGAIAAEMKVVIVR